MFFFQEYLPGVLMAALASAFVMGVSGQIWKRNVWGAAVALGEGYSVGHFVVLGWPDLPPHTAVQWLAWFAGIVTIVAVLHACFQPRWYVRLFVWSAVCVPFLGALLYPRIHHAWTTVEAVLWIAGLTAVAILTSSLEKLVKPATTTVILPLIVTILAAGTSAVLMLSGSMLLSQLASVFAAAAAAIAALTLIMPGSSPDVRSSALPAALLLVGLWTSGYFYAEVPAAAALLLVVAPVVALLVGWGRRDGHRVLFFQAIAVCVLVLGAVIVAFRASPPFS